MPQLQINQGPQDALLYDNSRSYFTNVGYVRTSNFQVEYRDCEAQNKGDVWGQTMQWVIPKAADLLGPLDLVVEVDPIGSHSDLKTSDWSAGPSVVNSAGHSAAYWQWVDELGFAMIEKVTFSIGNNDIETILGEQLQMQNELMTADEMRLGFDHVMKTGKPAFLAKSAYDGKDHSTGAAATDTVEYTTAEFERPGDNQTAGGKKVINKDYSRLIALQETIASTAATTGFSTIAYGGKRKLIVPLGLFFTKHVSQYFPLAAVAGCNDVRVSIKFRTLKELVQIGGRTIGGASGAGDSKCALARVPRNKEIPVQKCVLRAHYVHVTGPEAQVLMNKEHVRLLKLYQHETKTFTDVSSGKLDLDLSFLHPVSTLLITIRRDGDMNTSENGLSASTTKALADPESAGKGFFFYHGDGTHPNYDAYPYLLDTRADSGDAATRVPGTVKVNSVQLTLNGQERHPGLDKGIDADYLRARLLPMLHSNSNQYQKQVLSAANCSYDNRAMGVDTTEMEVLGLSAAAQMQYALQGSKNIIVYPFSLNPEGTNPSGAVNFSKVSHAKLTLHLDSSTTSTSPLHLNGIGMPGSDSTSNTTSGLRVDVYALYYNWLQIKDGRALLSFA